MRDYDGLLDDSKNLFLLLCICSIFVILATINRICDVLKMGPGLISIK